MYMLVHILQQNPIECQNSITLVFLHIHWRSEKLSHVSNGGNPEECNQKNVCNISFLATTYNGWLALEKQQH